MSNKTNQTKNMKVMTKVSLIVFFITLMSCSSIKTYDRSMFGNDFLKNQTVIFTLNEKSMSVGVAKEGPSIGASQTPNNRQVFEKSIKELAKETGLNLKYMESYSQSNDSEIHIDATITQIKWVFTVWSATMTSYLKYDISNTDSQYESIGTFKNASGGSATNNIYKSLKNAHYLLLKEMENNKEIK